MPNEVLSGGLITPVENQCLFVWSMYNEAARSTFSFSRSIAIRDQRWLSRRRGFGSSIITPFFFPFSSHHALFPFYCYYFRCICPVGHCSSLMFSFSFFFFFFLPHFANHFRDFFVVFFSTSLLAISNKKRITIFSFPFNDISPLNIRYNQDLHITHAPERGSRQRTD